MNHFWPICHASHLFLLPLTHAATAAEVVPYTLSQAGRVSAAVYDAEGRLVRELLHAAPKDAGAEGDVSHEPRLELPAR